MKNDVTYNNMYLMKKKKYVNKIEILIKLKIMF